MFKIPILDEAIRGVQSVGDLCVGNTDRAASRWNNWANDSFLATAAKSSSAIVIAGVAKIAGDDVAAKELLDMANDNGQKLGAISLSCAYQAGGIGAQIVTLGIPNPVSGACNDAAGGMNKVINECAEKKGVDWENLAKEAVIGLTKGAASSGGLIPYTGTVVDQAIRGKEISVDHGQEWANWGLSIGTSVITAGAVKGTSALTNAGKLGVRTSAAVAGTAGVATGFCSGIASQVINNDAEMRKILSEGYQYSHDMTTKDGLIFKVFCKNGGPDRYVPEVYIGDAISQGLISGAIQAMTAAKESSQIKREKKLAQAQNKVQSMKNQSRPNKQALTDGEKKRLFECKSTVKRKALNNRNKTLLIEKDANGSLKVYVQDHADEKIFEISSDNIRDFQDLNECSMEKFENDFKYHIQGDGANTRLEAIHRVRGGSPYNHSDPHDVYNAFGPDGNPNYIGITSNFDKRFLQHLKKKGIRIEKIEGMSNINYNDARCIEQVFIDKYGLKNLLNKNNGIKASDIQPGGKHFDLYKSWQLKLKDVKLEPNHHLN